MNKNKLYEKQLQDDQGFVYALEYWLTSRNVIDEEDNEEMVYGVEIVKYNNDCPVEIEDACCLSNCKMQMETWIHTLAKSSVTPITLLSLVDDYLSSWNRAV